MELQKIEGLFRASWPCQSLDAWSQELRDVCGNCQSVPVSGSRKAPVTGLIESIQAGGVLFAHIAYDLATVERSRLDIRHDANEFLFLVVQLGGSSIVEHLEQRVTLTPGECILIDSTRPVKLISAGLLTNHLSIHLPRQLMMSGSAVPLALGRKLTTDDPMATTLYSLATKVVLLQASPRSLQLRALLFESIRFAFEIEAKGTLVEHCGTLSERCELIEDLIDRHLTDVELTPGNIARRLNQPLRKLQADLHSTGRTLSCLIREKRLKLVAQTLQCQAMEGHHISISQVAYACGFNDISYFNRCFRAYYDITPSEFVSEMTQVYQIC